MTDRLARVGDWYISRSGAVSGNRITERDVSMGVGADSLPAAVPPRRGRLARLISGGLLRFLLRRLILAVLLLFFIFTMVFFLLRCAPGDPTRHLLPENATPAQQEQL